MFNLSSYFATALVATVGVLSTGHARASEADRATELLAASLACPIEPLIRKEVRQGVMLFYNARVFQQRFTGNATTFKFAFEEKFTQKTEPGLGGDFEATYRREGEVTYRDLQKATLHAQEWMNKKQWILLSCVAGKACYTEVENGKNSLRTELDLMFCDEATARNALLAINALMKASK